MLKTGAADWVEIPAEHKAEVEAAGIWTKVRPGGGTVQVLLGGMVLPIREGYDPALPWTIHQDEPEAVADYEAGWGKVTGGSEWNQRALKVRMAMQYAINVDAIIDNIFHGAAVKNPIGHGGGWAPFGAVGTRPEWEPFPYDPALSKQLLVEAGYPDGFEFTFIIYSASNQPAAETVAEAVARDFEAIGLTVKRQLMDYAVQRPIFADRESAWMVKLDAYAPWWEPWSSIGFTNGSTNMSYNDGFESLELDVLVTATETALDIEARREAGLAMGDYFRARYSTLSIALTGRVYALSPKVGDWPLNLPPWSAQWARFEYATHAD